MNPGNGKRVLGLGALFLSLSAFFIFLALTRAAPEPRAVIVAKGISARGLARELKREGFIWHPWTFLVWTKLPGTRGAIRPGVYQLSARASGRSILKTLQHGPPLVRITVPEGWTARQIATLLEAKGISPANEFLAHTELEKREGFLFPDTYFFQQLLPAPVVIDRMVRRFDEKAPTDLAAQEKALHLSRPQIVTLASLVEKEAREPSERPLIAGVFYNRLKKHWRLESCATVQYALGSWKPQLTYKDLDVNSPYNTYRHPGLPPGPICNPGAAALEAASHPAQTDLMFFVADGQGTHRFSRYYNEHLNAKRKRAASSKQQAVGERKIPR